MCPQAESDQVKRTQRCTGIFVKKVNKSPAIRQRWLMDYSFSSPEIANWVIYLFLINLYPVSDAASGTLRVTIEG